MSNNKSNNIFIPKFLDEEETRKINNHIYKNTGCFLFLHIPKISFFSPIVLNQGGDNYRYNLLNLYKMYNDYGHYFLWFCIQNSQLELIRADTENKDVIENIVKLEENRSRIADHYAFITKTARHVLAHGIFECPAGDGRPSYVDPKISEMNKIFREVLNKNDKDKPTSAEDWKKLARWVKEEADELYSWLWQWGELWGESSMDARENLKRRFYYGRWDYAINKDNCVDADKPESYSLIKYNNKDILLYEEADQNLTSFARVFSAQFVFDAKEYLAGAAGDRKSQYEEGYKSWKSKSPAVNWKILYKNINFAGVENVRTEMLKGTSKACPDGFRLYLTGLNKIMLDFPEIQAKPKSSKTRFHRPE